MSRTPSQGPRPARRPLTRLPTFGLYGEEGDPAPSMLHIESIDSRSRLHDWEIDAHRHQGLHQVLWLRTGQVGWLALVEARCRDHWPVSRYAGSLWGCRASA